MKFFLSSILNFLLLFFLTACVSNQRCRLLISVADQKMILFEDGKKSASYPVSTSQYGVGDEMGSCKTPLGRLVVVKKIGANAPLGMAFKDRKATGEILIPNTPGRDPIVTRILWLRGKEAQNKNAFARYIYIHGTPQEKMIGIPKSFGCIRMKSMDVIALYEKVGEGTQVEIIEEPLNL